MSKRKDFDYASLYGRTIRPSSASNLKEQLMMCSPNHTSFVNNTKPPNIQVLNRNTLSMNMNINLISKKSLDKKSFQKLDSGQLRTKMVSPKGNNKIDLETLYDYNIRLKENINNIKREYKLVKSNNIKAKEELVKKDKILDEVLENSEFKTKVNQEVISRLKEMSIINNIKIQYKELQAENKSLSEELYEAKKTLKFGKIKQYRIENEALLEEFKRLKEGSERFVSDLNKASEELRKENEDFKEKINAYENELGSLRADMSNLGRENEALKEEVTKCKEKIKDLRSGKGLDPEKLSQEDKQISYEILNKAQVIIFAEHLRKQIKILENENKTLASKIIMLSKSDEEDERGKATNDYNEKNKAEELTTLTFTEDKFNDFLFILLKCIESRGLVEAFSKDIFIAPFFGKISDSNLPNLITTKLINILKIKLVEDKTKIMVFINSLMNVFGNSNPVLLRKLEEIFSFLRYYSESEIEYYNQKIIKVLSQHFNYIKNTFSYYDEKGSGIISYESLRKIVEIINYTDLDNDMMDYLIFMMKKGLDSEHGLDELKYTNLLDFLEENKIQEEAMEQKEETKVEFVDKVIGKNVGKSSGRILGELDLNSDDILDKFYARTEQLSSRKEEASSAMKNTKYVEKEGPGDEDGGGESIEISTEQYNERIKRVYTKLVEYLTSNNITLAKLFELDIFVQKFENQDETEVIKLQRFCDVLSGIDVITDSVDIYCLFSDLKVSDDDEVIDYVKFEKHAERYINKDVKINNPTLSVWKSEGENSRIDNSEKTIHSNDLKHSFT